MAHRQEPKPTNKRDAEWAVMARAKELVDYLLDYQKGAMRHITEVKLIEAVNDLDSFQNN
jgi:hypothetical protein